MWDNSLDECCDGLDNCKKNKKKKIAAAIGEMNDKMDFSGENLIKVMSFNNSKTEKWFSCLFIFYSLHA